MKPTQRLIVNVENITFEIRARDLDEKLHGLAERLHFEGDEFGPVHELVQYPGGLLCVGMCYADMPRTGQKRIFGFKWEQIKSLQKKGN